LLKVCVTSRTLAAALLLVSATATPSFAQTSADGPDPESIRLRLGPLMVNPRIGLTNLGVDDNVFNQAEDQNPKRDVTATVTPMADLWLRMGPSWLQSTIREDLVWYQTYASERATNSRLSAEWRLPLNHLHIKLAPFYTNTRERPGFEIDARSQRIEYGGTGTIELRVASKTFLGVNASWQQVDFDSVATFDGVNLRDALNRTVETAGAQVRERLTPLTSLTFTASREQARFTFSPLRDSNSTSLTAAVEFEPFALIKGRASIGYRNFDPLSPGLPDYKGLTANGDLSYTLLGTTRFGVQFIRDVQYSYFVDQPYYLQTGVSGSVMQKLFGPLDVVVRGGTQQLAYRDREGVFTIDVNRVDYFHTYGGGLGYHIGRDLRIGFNVDQEHRISDVSRRQYDALRYGTSVTYGF
jgi:putative beta-barrel porin BBP2